MIDPKIKQALQAISFFQGLEDDDLTALAQAMIVRRYETGQVVFLEDEPSDGLYMIESGVGKLYSVSERGREYILTTLKRGDSCNEVTLIDDGPNPISLAAVENMTVLVIPKDVIKQLCETNPLVYTIIAKSLAARCRQLVRQVCRLSLLSVTGRLAAFLLARSNGSNFVEYGWTQAELAAYLGTVREMVNRALRELQKTEVIRINGSTINIIDPERLEELAE